MTVSPQAVPFIQRGFAVVRVLDKKPQFRWRVSGELLGQFEIYLFLSFCFIHIKIEVWKIFRLLFFFLRKYSKHIFPQDKANANFSTSAYQGRDHLNVHQLTCKRMMTSRGLINVIQGHLPISMAGCEIKPMQFFLKQLVEPQVAIFPAETSTCHSGRSSCIARNNCQWFLHVSSPVSRLLSGM